MSRLVCFEAMLVSLLPFHTVADLISNNLGFDSPGTCEENKNVETDSLFLFFFFYCFTVYKTLWRIVRIVLSFSISHTPLVCLNE